MTAGFLLALKLLDLIALGVENWAAAKPAIDKLQAQMKRFAVEKRDPTLEEWAVIDAETNALMDSIMTDPPAVSTED